MKQILLSIILFFSSIFANPNPELQKLSSDFWAWRTITQPAASDDIPRLERPENWVPDFSPKAIEANRNRYRQFREQLDALDKSQFSRSDSVDYLCLYSAIERVNWELSVLETPHRNPDFYVHQTLGAFWSCCSYTLLSIKTALSN